MAAQRPDSGIVLSTEQLACLASPARAEVLNALLASGSASVGELARQTGRSAKGLYYHLRQMDAEGLVRVEETRPAGRRQEAVYGVVSRSMLIDALRPDPQYRAEAIRSVSATLRMVDREHRRFVEARAEYPELERLVPLMRQAVRLSDADLETLRAKAAELMRFAKEHHAPEAGQRVSVTVAVLPLVRE